MASPSASSGARRSGSSASRSGKTVPSRSVMGLLTAKNVIREGSATYGGEELVGVPKDHLRPLGHEMAMVFQDPMTSLNPVLKIGRQITEGTRYHLDVPKDEAWSSRPCAAQLGWHPRPDPADHQYPHELSGGMRQHRHHRHRACVRPSSLFADEPTTALDVTVQAQILNLLNQQQTSGTWRWSSSPTTSGSWRAARTRSP